jgi:hypothetical protein
MHPKESFISFPFFVASGRGTCGEDVSGRCLSELAFEEPVEELRCKLLVFGIGLIAILRRGLDRAGRGLVRWEPQGRTGWG